MRVELGDAVDQPRDLVAEQPLDVVEGGAGVLDRIVQQRRDDRGGVQPVVGQDAGDFERMARNTDRRWRAVCVPCAFIAKT